MRLGWTNQRPVLLSVPEAGGCFRACNPFPSSGQVKALNGFTTIEADVEFIPAPPAATKGPDGAPCLSGTKAAKKPKKKEKARAASANGGAPGKTSPAKAEPKPVQLHFRFLREARGHGSGGGMFPRGVSDGVGSSSDEEDDSDADGSDDSDAGTRGVQIEVLDDEESEGRVKAPGGRKMVRDGAKATHAKSKHGPDGDDAISVVKGDRRTVQAAVRPAQKGPGQRKRGCSADGDGYRDVEGSRDDAARRKRSKGSPQGTSDSGIGRRGFARGDQHHGEEDEEEEDDDDEEVEGWPDLVLGGDRTFFTRVSEVSRASASW